ncbi:hypothetical protein B296_00007841 [Ensete ventricosum]|uniref:Uncharacterized protein n=1 Tax=Ensete ventricosum TaxID=4639 RepID=A0A426ZV62_ENSVE|nr:hypothetical protein B296_00007841 [Ensete ventricosum]
MDQSALRGMPKVSTDKSTPATRVTPSSLEVCVEPAPRIAPAPTPKMSVEKLVPRQEDPSRTHKWDKVVVGKQKSWHGEGSSRVPSKDKGSIALSEELVLPARS